MGIYGKTKSGQKGRSLGLLYQPPWVLSAKLNELAGFRAELTLMGSLHAGMKRLLDETNVIRGNSLALDHPAVERKSAVLTARQAYRHRGCLDIRMEPKWRGLRTKADVDIEMMSHGEETFWSQKHGGKAGHGHQFRMAKQVHAMAPTNRSSSIRRTGSTPNIMISTPGQALTVTKKNGKNPIPPGSKSSKNNKSSTNKSTTTLNLASEAPKTSKNLTGSVFQQKFYPDSTNYSSSEGKSPRDSDSVTVSNAKLKCAPTETNSGLPIHKSDSQRPRRRQISSLNDIYQPRKFEGGHFMPQIYSDDDSPSGSGVTESLSRPSYEDDPSVDLNIFTPCGTDNSDEQEIPNYEANRLTNINFSDPSSSKTSSSSSAANTSNTGDSEGGFGGVKFRKPHNLKFSSSTGKRNAKLPLNTSPKFRSTNFKKKGSPGASKSPKLMKNSRANILFFGQNAYDAGIKQVKTMSREPGYNYPTYGRPFGTGANLGPANSPHPSTHGLNHANSFGPGVGSGVDGADVKIDIPKGAPQPLPPPVKLTPKKFKKKPIKLQSADPITFGPNALYKNPNEDYGAENRFSGSMAEDGESDMLNNTSEVQYREEEEPEISEEEIEIPEPPATEEDSIKDQVEKYIWKELFKKPPPPAPVVVEFRPLMHVTTLKSNLKRRFLKGIKREIMQFMRGGPEINYPKLKDQANQFDFVDFLCHL